MCADPRQNVIGAFQRDVHLAIVLFHLVRCYFRRAVVGHGGSHHQGIGVHGVGLYGFKQVFGRGERHLLHKRHVRLGAARRGQQHDLRAAQHTGTGHGVTHLAGGVVGQVTHGVHRLLGGTGRDHHLFARQVLLAGQLPQHVIHQHALLGQTAGADVAAGQQAGAGRDDRKAVMLQRPDVILGNGVFQHVGVHGRGHQLGAVGRQGHGGQHVVGLAVGHFGNHIGRGRGDEHQVGGVGKADMCHVVLEVAVKRIHDAASICQRFKHQRGDELGGVLGHQHMDVGAQFDQRVGHIGHFISGNAPGNAEDDGFAFQVHGDHILHNVSIPVYSTAVNLL